MDRSIKSVDECIKDNLVIRNDYAMATKENLGPKATQLYVWCISQIKKTDNDIVYFEISSRDLGAALELANIRRDMESIAKQLSKFQVYLKNSSGSFGYVNVMESCFYNNQTKMLYLAFGKTAWQCFTGLTNNFSMGALECFFKSKNQYAFNLYLFLDCNKSQKGGIKISLEKLMAILGCPSSYSIWGNMNTKVLKPLHEYFKKSSLIKFNYKPDDKLVRKYHGVHFYNIKKTKVIEDHSPNPVNRMKIQDGSSYAIEHTKDW